MAGFEVTLYGRIWVTTKVQVNSRRWELFQLMLTADLCSGVEPDDGIPRCNG